MTVAFSCPLLLFHNTITNKFQTANKMDGSIDGSNPGAPTVAVTESTGKVTCTPGERKWVDLLREAFIGDVVACLSISRALKADQVRTMSII